ncbi:MAG: class I SAM-dependent methyltransferase [Candidatus Eremiobacterota bacterium]
MESYDRYDAKIYDYYSTGLEGDDRFYLEEAKKSGSPVLELGCGTGRILIPVAEAGIKITGLDASSSMLSVAGEKISRLKSETRSLIKLVEGDMRDFSLEEKFNLIMIPYRAFLHLLTPEDQKSALTCIHKHLSEKGHLIFNIFDPSLEILHAHSGPLGSAMKKDSEFIHPENGHKVIVWDTRQYNLEKQILEQYFIFEELNEEGKVISKKYIPLTLKFAYRYEMEYLLELCGYRVEALYGDFDRSPFRCNEQIWVAVKK